MKIVYLGPQRPRFESYLRSNCDELLRTYKKITAGSEILTGADWLVSYGYRHIIKSDVLQMFPNRIVNLHISLLPFNRGTDPNLWSFLEETSRGVSIHFVDSGVDTGDILAQEAVTFAAHETLRSTYDRLSVEIENLFMRVWPEVVAETRIATPQTGAGTSHRSRDKEPFLHLLTDGWETPVEALIGRATAAT